MARSWRFNLGVGFLLWLAALAVVAQSPAFVPASQSMARPVAPAMRLTPSDLQAVLLRAAANEARAVALRAGPLERARVAAVPLNH